MARYTDDLRAARAIREPQARRDAEGPSDADGFTADDHIAQAELSFANMKRAHSCGVPSSGRFEAGQVIAHVQAYAALATVQELLS